MRLYGGQQQLHMDEMSVFIKLNEKHEEGKRLKNTFHNKELGT